MELTLNSQTLCYTDTGAANANALVILHGWGQNKESFSQTVSVLSPYMRVIALDLPGFGGSSEPTRAWSVSDYCDCVCEFITALGVKSVSLVGHSFGGRVVIKLSARDNLPFKIDKLVLIDSAGLTKKKIGFAAKFKRARNKLYRKILGLPAVSACFPNALENFRNKYGSPDYKNASPRMRECLVMAVNEDLRAELPKITRPTLLIWGENDDATPIDMAREMETLIPDAGLVTIKNAGHFSYLEQPAVYLRVMCSYFNINLG